MYFGFHDIFSKSFNIFYFYWYSVTNKHDAKQTIEESPPARPAKLRQLRCPRRQAAARTETAERSMKNENEVKQQISKKEKGFN